MLDLSKFPGFMEVNNEICDDYRQDDTLDKLQQLNVKYGDGKRWCSWEKNLEEIVKNATQLPSYMNDLDKVLEAIKLYTLHKVLNARYDTIRYVWRAIERDTNGIAEEAEA